MIGPLRVGRIAHGGHWVVRDDGRVLFVRGALEGELVRVRVTEAKKRHAFAEVVEVIEASDQRVQAPCPIADGCGGCDFQHVAPAHQLELKRQVVAEQLSRLAGIAWDGTVEPVTPQTGWRTRVRYHADADAWGMHPVRSHAVVPLPEQGCLIAAPGLERPVAPPEPGEREILGVRSADETIWLAPRTRHPLTERAAGRTWATDADGFWQIHPRAADTFVDAVLAGLDPRPGETALDLYCGVGLFAGALVDRGAQVTGIEGNRRAVELARLNVPEGRFLAGDVGRLASRLPRRADLVVLDPPRTGAGASVLDAVFARQPRAIAYVACDPAALARDLAHAQGNRWHLESLRAFDAFGMTNHVECVAILKGD